MPVIYYFEEQDDLWDRLYIESKKQYNYMINIHPADKLQIFLSKYRGKVICCNGQIIGIEFEFDEDLPTFILTL
jgi:hypothetical protein